MNMNGFRTVLSSKIHRATVTHADLHYEGSITLPPMLMETAGIFPYELVHVWNITRGTRFETYAIEGLDESNAICVNGAAAHLVKPEDLIIIANFVSISEAEIAEHAPKAIFVDRDNRIVSVESEVPGPLKRPRALPT